MSFTNYEICPLMSTATDKAPCSSRCAWYDDELAECAISRINGNTKWLQDISEKLSICGE